jgi:chromosome segregation ATPase
MFDSPINVIILVVFVVLLWILIEVVLLPNSEKKKKKIKKVEQEQLPNILQSQWEEKISKFEHRLKVQHDKILQFEQKELQWQKDIVIEKAKTEKFHEKLLKEREWHEKENSMADKSTKELDRLKAELKKEQDQFSKEHLTMLRLNQDYTELRKSHDQVTEEKRLIELELRQFKTKYDDNRQEIAQLKKEVAILSQKKQDEEWVAKSDYIKLEQDLRRLNKELEQAKHTLERIKNE